MQFIEEEEDGALKRIEDISTTVVERKKMGECENSRWHCALFCASTLWVR